MQWAGREGVARAAAWVGETALFNPSWTTERKSRERPRKGREAPFFFKDAACGRHPMVDDVVLCTWTVQKKQLWIYSNL